VKDLSRVTDHEPLSVLLTRLLDNPDLHLKHQATYALQALLHIPNDETRRDFVLRHAGNIAMGLLGVASVCKLDVSEVKEGAAQLYKSLVDVHDITIKATEGARSLHASGQDIMSSVKGGIFSGGRQLWYSALREAQEHMREGRLADFNSLVFEAPCSRDVEFQWGICQLLGEISTDPLWSVVVRQQAVDFLAQLYRGDTFRNSDKDICTYILNLLRRIDDLAGSPVSTHARSQLRGLAMEGGAAKQILYHDTMAGPFIPSPLKVGLSGSFSSPMLDRVQAIPEVDRTLSKLRAMRLKESANALYIPPQAKPTSRSGDDTLFSLMENTIEFCAGPRQVLLLLGDSGGGKSTFNLQLENTLWQSYKRGDPIPLHINLPAIDNPHQNMIAKRLQQLDFSDAQIQELKKHRQFIVICDGYDESQLKKNLYTTNLFNQTGQWNVKLVIACRIQYLGPDYRTRFQPNAERYQQQQQHQQAADQFQESFIAPFSGDQIKEYVEQYVARVPQHTTVPDQQKWSAKDYMDKLSTIHGLMELVSNPFLLTLALRALPKAVRSEKDISKIRLTRVSLYDIFMEQWLENNKYRLQDSLLSSEAQTAFDTLCDADFIQQGMRYQKDLAAAIFQHQDGNPVVDYVHLRESRSWKAAFFGLDMQTTLLRESCPLARSGNQYRFLHRSLLEYLYSRLISDPIDLGDIPTDNADPCILVNHPLNRRNITKESSILHFLIQRVNSDPSFKTLLMDAVETSRKDDRVSQAAANAITILVKANVWFNGADLSGVRIPGASLRYGQFDCADLRGADLTGVNLSKAWLRKANLSGAHMAGVEFEELPYLEVGGGIRRCAFSSDGKLLVVSTYSCSIDIYDTSTWKEISSRIGKTAIAISPCNQELANASIFNRAIVGDLRSGGEVRLVLSGHDDAIDCICYSPDGRLIATGSKDKTVRVWSTESGDTVHILSGHTLVVTGVAFSPLGLHLSSCSEDKTIRTWNVETGEMITVLECAAPAHALAYSPDGQQIASCGDRGDVRLWSVDSGVVNQFLSCHAGSAYGVAFTPDGRQVVTCSDSGAVVLSDSRSGDTYDTLSGDRYQANCVAFSPAGDLLVAGGIDRKLRLWPAEDVPSETILMEYMDEFRSLDISMDGQMIVTGCVDGVVQLWETSTGKPGIMLEGHTRGIRMVVFSPCGKRVASIDWDSTLRILCASTGKLIHILDEADIGDCVAFAPDGTRFATTHNDHTIRIWDAQSGKAIGVLEGHTDEINGAVYSPSGHQIASCSKDMTIRLWSTQTDECLHVLSHSREVDHLDYSADGQYIVSLTVAGSNRWDSQSGESLEPWNAINMSTFWCSFSTDGRLLATVESEENCLRLMCLSSDECVEIHQSFIGPTWHNAWRRSLDGTFVFATIDNSYALRVWRLKEEEAGSDGSFKLMLAWSVGLNGLSLEGAIMDDIVGLTPTNLKVMKQRSDVEDVTPDWSEGSTEEWYRIWGYFGSDDDDAFDDEDEEDSDVDMNDSDLEEDEEAEVSVERTGEEVKEELSERAD
ncbi:hypothetical protein BGZ95_005121, partial [Linnemannia exigua]